MGRTLLQEPGINWVFFTEIEIIGDKCKLGRSWRAHKFEDRGAWPKEDDTIIHGEIRRRDLNIGLRIGDGRPGNTYGLKALYRRPPYVSIEDQYYQIIK